MGSMKTKMTNAAVGEERPEVLETARRAGSAPRSPGLGNEYERTGVCAAAALQDGRAAPGCAWAPGLRGAGGRGTRVSKGPRASRGRVGVGRACAAPHRAGPPGLRARAALTAASASCFFCRMSVAVLSLCFSSSLTRGDTGAR